MAPLHRVYFLGTVLQDPRGLVGPNGMAVARCGLAVPTRLRQGDTWHEDVCCNRGAGAFGRRPTRSRPARHRLHGPDRRARAVVASGAGGPSCHTRRYRRARPVSFPPPEDLRPAVGGRGACTVRVGGGPIRGRCPACVRAWRVWDGHSLAIPRRHWGPRPASHVRAGVISIETKTPVSHVGGEAVRRARYAQGQPGRPPPGTRSVLPSLRE